MRPSKPLLIFIALLLFHVSGECQFYKKFDLEIGVNRSKVINTRPFSNFSNSNNSRTNSTALERSESASYTNNSSISIGYRIASNHHIRIRQAINDIGSHIDGIFTPHNTSFCGIGAPGPTRFRNAHNLIKSKSIGGQYEFHIPIEEGGLTLGAGIEKQWYSYEDTFVAFLGYSQDSYAVHSSIGYLVPIFKLLHLHSKLFITQSFANNEALNAYDHYPKEYLTEYGSQYVPLQIGFEVALRMKFGS